MGASDVYVGDIRKYKAVSAISMHGDLITSVDYFDYNIVISKYKYNNKHGSYYSLWSERLGINNPIQIAGTIDALRGKVNHSVIDSSIIIGGDGCNAGLLFGLLPLRFQSSIRGTLRAL